MTLPAWDEITSSDEWKALGDADHREVFRSYLADISKVKDFKELSGKDKFVVIRAMQTDAGLYQEEPKSGLFDKDVLKKTASDLAHNVRAVTETGIGTLQGMGQFLGGAGTELIELALSGGDVKKAQAAKEKAIERLNLFQPQTPEAQTTIERIGRAIEPVMKTGAQIGGGPGQVFRSPALERAGEIVGEVGIVPPIAKAFKGVRPTIADIREFIPTRERVKGQTVPVAKEVVAEAKPSEVPTEPATELTPIEQVLESLPLKEEVKPVEAKTSTIPKEVIDQIPLKEEVKTTIPKEVLDQIPLADYVGKADTGKMLEGDFNLVNPETEIFTGDASKKNMTPTTTLFSGVDLTQIPAMYRKLMESKPMRAIVGFFDPEANIPQGKEFMFSRQGAKGSIALGEKLADAFVKKYKDLTPDERTAIWEQMNSGDPVESLPTNLQAPAKVFRQVDNALGKMLVDEGLMTEETYKANEGNHIRYIYNIYQEGGDLAGSMGQKLDTKFIKSRKDMTDLERERLGLVKDPLQAIAQSITDTYRAVGMSQHFRTIAANPQWVFSPSDVVLDGKKMGIGKVQKMLDAYDQVEKAGSKLNPEQIAYREKMQTALKEAEAVDVPKDFIRLDGPQYGELDGRYVKKEIAQDIKPILDVFKTSSAGTNKAVSAIVAANGLWKMKNVALNVPTAARNTISNPFQLLMSGMRPDHVVTRTVEAITEMAKDGKYYNEALRQGQFKTNFTTGELEDILAIAKDFDHTNWVHFMSKVQNLGKYYGKIDDVFKLAKFIDERKAGKSVQEAAYQANKWGMDYSFTHPAIKVLRNSPIGAPFVSYQYKIAPLIVESLKKRPWVIASIMSIPMLLQKQITKDMTDEDAKKFMESLPEYVQNKQVFLIPGTHGMNALDISYMVPWGNWYQVANSVKNEKISKAFKQMGIASGLLPSLMYGVSTGKDLFTGKDIVDPLNQYDNKAAAWDMTKWIWQQAAPPMLTETSVAGKVSEHLQHGQTSKGLKTEGMNVWPRVVGVNIYPVDPTGKSRGERYEIQNVRKALARKIYDKNLSPKEREAARQAYMMAVKEIRKIEPEETEEKQFE